MVVASLLLYHAGQAQTAAQTAVQAPVPAPARLNPAGSFDLGNGYVEPGKQWEHIAPAQAGFSAARLEVLRAFLKTHQTLAMVVISKGHVVFEYGDTSRSTALASARKSVLSMLFADNAFHFPDNLQYMSVVELGLEDPKVPFLELERHANFEHLLSSRSGIYIPSGNTDQDKVSPKRGSEYPGSHYFYNNWDFDAAGSVFERYTHTDIYDALRDQLAVPLGMQDFRRAQQVNTSPQNAHRYYPMWLSARDMARLGTLMLNHGNWGGKQLLDRGFLDWSTTLVTPAADMNPTGFKQIGTSTHWGYGKLWWVWDAPVFPGGTYAGPYQGAYSAMGSGGQYITVFPLFDLVVVHKVDIDADDQADVSLTAYGTMLDLLLDARCLEHCK